MKTDELTSQELHAGWLFLKTSQPMNEMLECPALKRVLLIVAKGIREKKITRTRELRLRKNLAAHDWKRAQANDFD